MKKKILTMLLSVACAFVLWFYVITVVSPGSDDTFHNIPVILDGEAILTERELMITSVPVDEVTLRLEGNRSDLNKLNRSNIDVIVDLSRITSPGTYRLRFDVAYPGDVPENAFTILEQSPAEVTVMVENRKTSPVPVQIEYLGNVPEGFVADKGNATLDYSRINITGPESVVDQIAFARIQVDMEGRKESITAEEYPITLCDAEGDPVDVSLVTPNVTEVKLDLKIQQWAEVDLFVEIIAGGGASKNNSTIRLTPDKIRLAGSEAALKQLQKGIIVGQINLGTMEKDTSVTFPLDLVIPEGVTNLSGITEVKVDVSFPNLTVREFSIPRESIELLNVPEGMEAVLITERLTVRVRGTTAQVKKMTAADITVKVDFADVAVGSATVKALIAIGGKYADVGEMGTHSVYVDLHEITPEEE